MLHSRRLTRESPFPVLLTLNPAPGRDTSGTCSVQQEGHTLSSTAPQQGSPTLHTATSTAKIPFRPSRAGCAPSPLPCPSHSLPVSPIG
ncbi:hypothetical protein E2C01_057751 [Portunus trituberculatus]|uniref:Uncharacterized protein n=1 Tax=Portunus trituberculatus TaxID=210409 RepID=A0A5B7GUE0_PORTR|nr:hypothetical protein [Portunus trituberculatus]